MTNLDSGLLKILVTQENQYSDISILFSVLLCDRLTREWVLFAFGVLRPTEDRVAVVHPQLRSLLLARSHRADMLSTVSVYLVREEYGYFLYRGEATPKVLAMRVQGQPSAALPLSPRASFPCQC